MTDQDKIIAFLQTGGPTLPAKVAKTIGSNILLASALLSELVSRGKVKVSHLKVGGSPLYYLPGQKEKLYQFASGNLNPKDLQILQTLKEKKILREANLDLLMKVSLRSLKDFAVPLHVTANGAKELFWKWYLLSEEETNRLIKDLVSVGKPAVPSPEPAPFDKTIPTRAAPHPPPPAEGVREEKRERPQQAPEERKAFIDDQKKIIKEEIKEDKKPFLQKFKEKITRKKKVDEFFPLIENYFSKLRINIEQKETIRKNAEMQFLLKVPSAVGKMTYFCKAKQKKRCDEKDLSSAYMEAQMKKLPLLFLYTNELSKKAEEMLDSGTFENVIVKKVE